MKKRPLSKDYRAIKSNLAINCKDCCGLCCVALYFNKTDGFPENKQAGTPCVNLSVDNTCKIYNQLNAKNLKGCINYDCFGAGQKVAQDWKIKSGLNSNQSLKRDIFKSFEMNRLLNQMLWYLIEAYTICDESKLELISQLIQENRFYTKLIPIKLIALDLENYRNRVNEELKQITLNLSRLSKEQIINKFQFEKDYSNQELSYLDFTMSYLIASNFEGCKLYCTNFLGADLRDVNIKNTDLSESLFLTQFQINSMIGNNQTKLPDGIAHPIHWANFE